MGYSYGRTYSGRYALCCDKCGRTGGVRKRTCRFKVTEPNGVKLPYCYPNALCSPCYTELGGSKGLHGEECREGAAKAQERNDREAAKLAAGDKKVTAAYGSWHRYVPDGMVMVLFVGTDHVQDFRLLPSDEYKTGGFLSDYPNAVPADGVMV